MQKLIAKKVSELLNKTVNYTGTEAEVEPRKWFTGSVTIPQDKKDTK